MNTSASSLPYSDTVRVRFSDTDAQGHLYFANYLVYADEVVGHYMEELGFSAMNPGQAPCFIFTVNLHCSYLGECRAFDIVRVRVGYSRLGNSSADVSFELYPAEIMCVAGFDWIVVDLEHSSTTLETAETLFAAAEAHGRAPVNGRGESRGCGGAGRGARAGRSVLPVSMTIEAHKW